MRQKSGAITSPYERFNANYIYVQNASKENAALFHKAALYL
jgi:hypothetical protein